MYSYTIYECSYYNRHHHYHHHQYQNIIIIIIIIIIITVIVIMVIVFAADHCIQRFKILPSFWNIFSSCVDTKLKRFYFVNPLAPELFFFLI